MNLIHASKGGWRPDPTRQATHGLPALPGRAIRPGDLPVRVRERIESLGPMLSPLGHTRYHYAWIRQFARHVLYRDRHHIIVDTPHGPELWDRVGIMSGYCPYGCCPGAS